LETAGAEAGFADEIEATTDEQEGKKDEKNVTTFVITITVYSGLVLYVLGLVGEMLVVLADVGNVGDISH
jgi:hypothetical protein